jgi:FMN phosphatase YigB (HAD superfamily)
MSHMNQPVIAFDVYNTLAHLGENPVRPLEVQDVLERFGVSASYQAIEAARQSVFYFDAPKREIHGYVDYLALQFDRMGLGVNLDVIESIAAMYEKRNSMIPFDDAVPALEAAKAKGATVIAFTTLPKFMLGRAADALLPKLDRYFDASATGYAKGDPRFYDAITTALGVNPSSVVCVGDDAVCDCELPRRAGWRPVQLVRDRGGSKSDFETVISLAEFATKFLNG